MAIPRAYFQILRLLRRHFYLRTNQIRDVVNPRDRDGAVTRGQLRALESHGYARRYKPKMANPITGSTAAPIWTITALGAATLATESGEGRDLLDIEPTFQDYMSLNHNCDLSGLHIILEQAIAKQDAVRLRELYYEHEVVHPDATDPAQKYRLYMVVQDIPRIVAKPDSAFETEYAGYRRAWIEEDEMGTDTVARVAAKKCKGHYYLAKQHLYRRWFPHARDMRVLAFCPSVPFRDGLRREMKSRPGAELWLFCAKTDFTVATALHGPIFYTVDGGPIPLVPAPEGVSATGASNGVQNGVPSTPEASK